MDFLDRSEASWMLLSTELVQQLSSPANALQTLASLGNGDNVCSMTLIVIAEEPLPNDIEVSKRGLLHFSSAETSAIVVVEAGHGESR